MPRSTLQLLLLIPRLRLSRPEEHKMVQCCGYDPKLLLLFIYFFSTKISSQSGLHNKIDGFLFPRGSQSLKKNNDVKDSRKSTGTDTVQRKERHNFKRCPSAPLGVRYESGCPWLESYLCYEFLRSYGKCLPLIFSPVCNLGIIP